MERGSQPVMMAALDPCSVFLRPQSLTRGQGQFFSDFKKKLDCLLQLGLSAEGQIRIHLFLQEASVQLGGHSGKCKLLSGELVDHGVYPADGKVEGVNRRVF